MHIILVFAILPTGRLRDLMSVSPGPGGPCPSRKLMLKAAVLDMGKRVLRALPSHGGKGHLGDRAALPRGKRYVITGAALNCLV